MESPNAVQRVLARVDALPTWQATALGVACGAGTALPLMVLDTPLALVPGAGLIGLWTYLAGSGEPRLVAAPRGAELAGATGVEPLDEESTLRDEPVDIAPSRDEPLAEETRPRTAVVEASEPSFEAWLECLTEPTPVEDPILGQVVGLPAGEFWMGSPEDEGYHDECPRHRVMVSAFAMGATPVTLRQWAAVMKKDTSEDDEWDAPFTWVSWAEAIAFCNAASEREGLDPCYEYQDEHWAWIRGRNGYRLPTEAEWEFACRAGTETSYSFGNEVGRLGDFAWFDSNADRLMPTAAKKENLWGLYDMHGNIWEWCWDAFDAATYRKRSVLSLCIDPVVEPSVNNANRVLRGGSFWYGAEYLRSSFRYWSKPTSRVRNFGFRCVRGPRQT